MIFKGVETRFKTSSFELDRPLPRGKDKNIIELMNNELQCRKNVKDFFCECV